MDITDTIFKGLLKMCYEDVLCILPVVSVREIYPQRIYALWRCWCPFWRSGAKETAEWPIDNKSKGVDEIRQHIFLLNKTTDEQTHQHIWTSKLKTRRTRSYCILANTKVSQTFRRLYPPVEWEFIQFWVLFKMSPMVALSENLLMEITFTHARHPSCEIS